MVLFLSFFKKNNKLLKEGSKFNKIISENPRLRQKKFLTGKKHG
jgi:hypothetical protein